MVLRVVVQWDLLAKESGEKWEWIAESAALTALHEMKAYGIAVYVWMPTDFTVHQRLDWLARHLGKDWSTRAIAANDPLLIHCTYLLVVEDKYFKSTQEGAESVSWKCIVTPEWSNWKGFLTLEEKSEKTDFGPPYLAVLHHGSADSKDQDIVGYSFS